jgi:ATP-binding cassette subfamily C protein
MDTQAASPRRKATFADIVGMLWFFYRHHKLYTAAIIALLIVAGMLENVGILAMLPAIQLVVAGDPSSKIAVLTADALAFVGLSPTLGTILALSFLAVLLKIVLTIASGVMNAELVADMINRLRLDIIRNLLRTHWSHFVRARTGRYVNLLSSESDRVVPAINQGIGLIADTIHTLLYLASALAVSAPIALLAVAVGAFKVIVMRPILSVARKSGSRQSQHTAILGAHLVEMIEMAKSIKAMAREAAAELVLRRDVDALRNAQVRNQFGALMMTCIDELLIAAIVVASFFVAVTFLEADLAQIAIVGVLMSRTMSRIGILQKRYYTAMSNAAALSELIGTLEELGAKQERGHGGAAPTLESGIEVRNLCLSYNDKRVIDGLNFRIPARGLTAITGPSGSGKTTLVDALIGLTPVGKGEILVDGRNLDDIDLHIWRRSIGYVPQETVLLHGTVFENVALHAEGVREADVVAALEAAEAADFVRALPQGIHTFVGERGLMLSGGQRQRLAIARALLQGPKLLVLDEATTALDSATEAEICQTLKRLSHSVTIIAISHQPAILSFADAVCRIEPLADAPLPPEA